MKHVLGALCALAALTAGSAAAKEPVRYEASSNWLLDYAGERCSLVRDFGAGDDSLQLRIESFGSRRSYRLTILGRAVPRPTEPIKELKFRFTPDEQYREIGALHGVLENARGASFGAEFEPPKPERENLSTTELQQLAATPRSIDEAYERTVSSIAIEFDGGRAVELGLGAMAAPLRAMRACVDDLQKTWGLDPEIQKGLSRLAVIKIDTVRDVQRTYPRTMMMAVKSAYVPVRVMVDAAGNATACVVQTDSAPKPFADSVCSGLMGSYEPALDSSGQPVPTVYLTSVIYQLDG